MKGNRYVYMDEAGGAEGGGGGGAGAAATAGAGGTAAPAAGGLGAGNAAAPAPAGGSGGVAAPAANALQQSGQEILPFGIPQKYQVKKEDGTLDLEASTTKLTEAHGHLERRLGSGDLPPKTAEEYTVTVPDELKDAWNPKEDALLGAFMKEAHAAGYSQKQLDVAMKAYMDIAPKLVAGDKALSMDECVTELKTEWKDEATYKGQMVKAFKAAQAYGDKDAQTILKKYGNDPIIIRMLARVGAEVGEDKGMPPTVLQGGKSIESVMASKAYNDPKHADHARVSAQVSAYFTAQAAQAEKQGRSPVM